ncbi:MAG: hypothetical protein KGI50_06870 [Patescibacteria group bacterium]|nr:hypothetical protein [Patescibacteria group bacterium]MDE2438825.1 hypothetical protein [Patescibacteria group bacterium]
MNKTEQINDPTSCWNKARDDEQVFVVLGRDLAAYATVCTWIHIRLELGLNNPDDPQILSAYALADALLEPGDILPKGLDFYFWKFVHNAIIHPLLAFPYEPKWLQKIHDWTSLRCPGGG